jgi:hypothetical protein
MRSRLDSLLSAGAPYGLGEIVESDARFSGQGIASEGRKMLIRKHNTAHGIDGEAPHRPGYTTGQAQFARGI